jgi:hypothetical protein
MWPSPLSQRQSIVAAYANLTAGFTIGSKIEKIRESDRWVQAWIVHRREAEDAEERQMQERFIRRLRRFSQIKRIETCAICG